MRSKDIKLEGLLEIKITFNKVNHIASNICGGYKVCTNATGGVRSRIWLIWRHDYYNVDVNLVHKYVIQAYAKHITSQKCLFVPIVYASNCIMEKENRETLMCLSNQIQGP